MQRAITNLLSNAIRHAHANSEVNLRIAFENENATLSVVNEGDGIAAENLERVFDRFYHADAARARLDGGAGLGLAIVRSIMSVHGGQVSAKSLVNGKTTFILSFPVKIFSSPNLLKSATVSSMDD